jgi:hypothetical protein
MTENQFIYMKDEPLARMGELWAKLYYHMAKEMLALGVDGEEALRRAIRNYGKDRGETTRGQAEAAGLPLTYETFQVTLKDMPFGQICKELVRYYPDASGCTAEEGFCAYAEFWKKYTDGWGVAKIYCDEFHHAKWKAFNPLFRVDMVSEITRGDHCCVLRSYVEGDEYDRERQETLRDICMKAKSYGFFTDTSPEGRLGEFCEDT